MGKGFAEKLASLFYWLDFIRIDKIFVFEGILDCARIDNLRVKPSNLL